MPHKDPEKRRAYMREYKKKWNAKPENREKSKKQWAKYKAENGDVIREKARLRQKIRRKEEPEKIKDQKKCSYHRTKHKHKSKIAKYGKQWHFENRDRRNKSAQKRHRMLKEKVIKYLGGCCSVCKLIDDYPVFDAHHLDPSQKKFSVMSGPSRDWNVIEPELDKCVLICSNCHRKLQPT